MWRIFAYFAFRRSIIDLREIIRSKYFDCPDCLPYIALFKSTVRHVSVSVDDAPNSYLPTRLPRPFERICFLLPETNVIRKFSITLRCQNFPDEWNSSPAIVYRGIGGISLTAILYSSIYQVEECSFSTISMTFLVNEEAIPKSWILSLSMIPFITY